jgi:uncharacterized protein (DUF983 family)
MLWSRLSAEDAAPQFARTTVSGDSENGSVRYFDMIRNFMRALLLRCPRCGNSDIMVSWFRFRGRCPNCDLDLNRDESGYQVGSYFIGITVLFALFAGLFVLALAMTWPNPPWRTLEWAGVILMIAGPLVLFPFSKTLYLALDLTLRPQSK